MKINEVEAAVGVTKKNIRFYEEEGLITPSREPGNGYRSYSQADVERLRRIKLLRKLDVPLAEIREMLEGQKTLAEGMAQQLERLSTRRKDLDEAIGFCTVLEKASGNLEELDVEQTLARLAAREEQGVTFVNIERTDRKGERIRGACIGAALFVALMAFVIATMAWAFYSDPQEAPPLPLLIVLFGIPVGCIVGTLKVLLERIEEIGKGEEDHFPIPRIVGMIHGQVQLEVLAVLPHLELVAEHDLGGVFGTVDDGDFPELAALVVDVVDERAQRRDAQAARHQKHVVAAHLVDGEPAAEGPADADDLAALHLVQPLGEASRAADAQLDEALLGGRRRDGDGRFPHAEDGQLHELARLLAEGLADALVHEAELEELLGGRELGDGGDARRPRAVGVRVHELGAGGLAPGVAEGMHGHDVVVRHGS